MDVRGNHYPKWVYTYIEMQADLLTHRSVNEEAKELGVTRQAISQYLRYHPEIWGIIREKIKKNYNALSVIAHRSLARMARTNPAALKMALEMAQDYVDKQEVTQKYDVSDPDKKQALVRELKRRFAKVIKDNNLPIVQPENQE